LLANAGRFAYHVGMNTPPRCRRAAAIVCLGACVAVLAADDPPNLPKAFIDGTGPGWKELTKDDFVNVNGNPDTWTFKDGGIHCSGRPIGVMRTTKPVTNFELVVQWKHLKSAGNSGVFVWVSEESLKDLAPDRLPRSGIEVQILDHGYKENYEKRGKKADFFTTNGDVFPVGKSKLKPFPPTSPNGQRSFPRKNLSKGAGEWNHYYVRGVNGEVRLWVNGEEVSGGNEAEPRTGYLALESEGSPIEFKHVRLRELP
jgi:3-keto-disaccharide hydrolase